MPSEIVLSVPQPPVPSAAPLPEQEPAELFHRELHAVESAAEVIDSLRNAGEVGIAPVHSIDRDGRPKTVFVNRSYVVTVTELAPEDSPAGRGPAEFQFQPRH